MDGWTLDCLSLQMILLFVARALCVCIPAVLPDWPNPKRIRGAFSFKQSQTSKLESSNMGTIPWDTGMDGEEILVKFFGWGTNLVIWN